MNYRCCAGLRVLNVTLLAVLALSGRAAEAPPVGVGPQPGWTAPGKMMFSEAGPDVIPLENRSRRKWDNAVVADLDQDGHPDLLLTEHSLRAIIFWNNGGKFSEPVEVIQGDTHGLQGMDNNPSRLTASLVRDRREARFQKLPNECQKV